MANSVNDKSIYHKFSKMNEASDPARLKSAAIPKYVPYQQLQRRPTPPVSNSSEEMPCSISVHIGGMQYKLMAPDRDGETYIREIAEKADQLIRQILKHTPGMSMMNVTVLSLVNALDELHQRESQMDELELEIAQYSEAVEANKSNVMHLREINWELKKEVLRLQSVIDSIENEDNEAYIDFSKQHMLPLEELAYDVLEQEEPETDDE